MLRSVRLYSAELNVCYARLGQLPSPAGALRLARCFGGRFSRLAAGGRFPDRFTATLGETAFQRIHQIDHATGLGCLRNDGLLTLDLGPDDFVQRILIAVAEC